jgi:hypothetical protein
MQNFGKFSLSLGRGLAVISPLLPALKFLIAPANFETQKG